MTKYWRHQRVEADATFIKAIEVHFFHDFSETGWIAVLLTKGVYLYFDTILKAVGVHDD